ncbi:MAG: hypothetical protein PW788_02910 [Micavibrio sp.]|nr:hypothetical protein [Micavibrio sp.]
MDLPSPLEITCIVLAIGAVGYIGAEMFDMQVKMRMRPTKFDVSYTPDDPLIVAAAEKSRATLPQFEELLKLYPQFSSLALGPIGPNGEVTPVLVKGKLADGSGYIVRKARTEKGQTIEEGEEFTAKTGDIVDWIVYESKKRDRIHGGFTLRAVVNIARRDEVYIPAHALAQERKFISE